VIESLRSGLEWLREVRIPDAVPAVVVPVENHGPAFLLFAVANANEFSIVLRTRKATWTGPGTALAVR
jgi:hypothetical protein